MHGFSTSLFDHGPPFGAIRSLKIYNIDKQCCCQSKLRAGVSNVETMCFAEPWLGNLALVFEKLGDV
jgi:hypothetical protein